MPGDAGLVLYEAHMLHAAVLQCARQLQYCMGWCSSVVLVGCFGSVH